MKKAGGRTGWLSREELAVRLGKTTRTVSRWVAQRVLPPPRRFPDGNYWRPEEVDRWLESYDKTPRMIDKALRERAA